MSSDAYFTQAHRQSAAGASSTLNFPPLYLDPDHSHSNDAPDSAGPPLLGSTYYHHPELHRLVSRFLPEEPPPYRGAEEAEADDQGGPSNALTIPQPRIAHEYIALNEDLVPAPLDMDGDTLPSEQHPSYPFGNLFGSTNGMLSADSAIMGSRAGRVEGLPFSGQLDLASGLGASNASGRRGAMPNSWNSSTNRSSRTKVIGPGGVPPESEENSEKAEAAKTLEISNSLLHRTTTTTVLAPPTWPFKKIGPGPTGYSALLRPCSNIHGDGPASQAVAATLGGLPASAKILREVWTDLAMEDLVPQPFDDSHYHSDDGQEHEEEDMDASRSFAMRIASLHPSPLDVMDSRDFAEEEESVELFETAEQAWMKEQRERLFPRAAGRMDPYETPDHRNADVFQRQGWAWGDELVEDETIDTDDED